MNWILRYDHDVSYQNDKSEEIKLQMIYPTYDESTENKDKKSFPCILYVKKQNEFQKECYSEIPRLIQFALRGYAVAYLALPANSRLSEETYINNGIDTDAVMNYLHNSETTYQIDTNRFILWTEAFSKQEISQLFSNLFTSKVKTVINSPEITPSMWTEEYLDYIEDDICSKL